MWLRFGKGHLKMVVSSEDVGSLNIKRDSFARHVNRAVEYCNKASCPCTESLRQSAQQSYSRCYKRFSPGMVRWAPSIPTLEAFWLVNSAIFVAQSGTEIDSGARAGRRNGVDLASGLSPYVWLYCGPGVLKGCVIRGTRRTPALIQGSFRRGTGDKSHCLLM